MRLHDGTAARPVHLCSGVFSHDHTILLVADLFFKFSLVSCWLTSRFHISYLYPAFCLTQSLLPSVSASSSSTSLCVLSLAVFSFFTFTSFPFLLFAISPLVPPAPTFPVYSSCAEQHTSRNTYSSTKHHIPFCPSC